MKRISKVLSKKAKQKIGEYFCLIVTITIYKNKFTNIIGNIKQKILNFPITECIRTINTLGKLLINKYNFNEIY